MLNKHKNPNNSINTYYLLPQLWLLNESLNLNNYNSQISGEINNGIQCQKPNISKLENFIEVLQKNDKKLIIDQVSQKLSFIDIDNFTLNPKLKTNTPWKIISQTDLLKFETQIKNSIGFLSLPFLLSNHQIQKENNIQNTLLIDQNYIQDPLLILFCSASQNHLYMGHHQKQKISPENLRNLINFFGYEQTQNTRIVFPEQNSFKKFKLQQVKLDPSLKIIMIYDLKKFDQVQFIEEYEQFQKGLYFLPEHILYQNHYEPRNRINEEDQITMADLDSISRVISVHTLSTGAETPSFTSFLLDQQENQKHFKTHNLFGQKKPEQIQIMRQYARQVIHNQLIQIKDKEDIQFQLQKIAEQIQQTLYKKRHCKDFKEAYFIKENNYHNIHFLANNKQQNDDNRFQ